MSSLMHENKKLDKPTLLDLSLETSSFCNLSCQMCPRPKENGTMPIDDIKRFIKEFADMGGETIKPFWRGEPTADNRMSKILEYAKDCKLKTMLNTNGHMVCYGIYKHLDWISFSIDVYHKNIDQFTLDSVLDAKKYVKYVEIQCAYEHATIKAFCEKNDIVYKVDLPTKRSNKDTTSEVIKGDRKYCKFPEWRMVVAYNGDCLPCCTMWDKSYVLGNIYEQSLKDIFYGDKANTLRSELKQGIFNNKECANCVSRSAYV